jgi:hypothetical protein
MPNQGRYLFFDMQSIISESRTLDTKDTATLGSGSEANFLGKAFGGLDGRLCDWPTVGLSYSMCISMSN